MVTEHMNESDVSGGSTTIQHDGFTIQSTDSAESMRQAFAPEPAEGTSKDAKIGADEVRSVQDGGKTRDGAGRFAGPVKPIKDAKPNGQDKAAAPRGEEPKPESTVQKETKAAQPKADEAPDADEIAQVKADEEAKSQQRRKDAAWRVQQATQQAAQERREREARDAEIARLKAELQSLKTPAPAKPTVPRETAGGGPPDPESYQTVAEYLDARDTWNRQQTIQEIRAEQHRQQEAYRAEQQQRQIEKYARDFEAAVSTDGALEGVDEDLLELRPSFFVQAEGGRPTAENALADEILAAGKNAPRLLRYLSDHQDQLRRLVQAPSPAHFAREMGRVEAQLEAAITAKPAKPPFQPGAFKPVPAVPGKPHAADDDEDLSGLDFDSYVSRRARQPRR